MVKSHADNIYDRSIIMILYFIPSWKRLGVAGNRKISKTKMGGTRHLSSRKLK